MQVRLLNDSGREMAAGTGTDVILTAADVHLWDGVKDPYLYTCQAALPLSSGAKVSAFSHSSTDFITCGIGSADISTSNASTVSFPFGHGLSYITFRLERLLLLL